MGSTEGILKWEFCKKDIMKLKDKVIIITGASSGIGEATAKLLAKEGVKVVLTARRAERRYPLSKTYTPKSGTG